MAGPTIEQIVAQIRTAIFGKDVRENIALGIEKCYDDSIGQDAVKKTDIANNLTTTTEGKVLDARQGKTLNDKFGDYVLKSDIANDLTTEIAGKVLDARQGYALNALINDYAKKKQIPTLANLNNYNTEGKYWIDDLAILLNAPNDYENQRGRFLDIKYLSGAQTGIQIWTSFSFSSGITHQWMRRKYNNGSWGNWIEILSTNHIANNLVTTTEGKVLDARQGKTLNDKFDNYVLKSDIANNLTTTTEGKVLDARQGRTLNDNANVKIYTASGLETNFADNVNVVKNKAINASGEIIDFNGICYTDFIYLDEREYVFGYIGPIGSLSITRVHLYNNGQWVKQLNASQLEDNKEYYKTRINTTGGDAIRISIDMRYNYCVSSFTDQSADNIKEEAIMDAKVLAASDTLTYFYRYPQYIKNKAINASGEIIDVQYMCYTQSMAMSPGKYVVSVIGTTNDNTVTRVHGYNNDSWVRQLNMSFLSDDYGYARFIIDTTGCSSIRVSTRDGYAIAISEYNMPKKEALIDAKILSATNILSNHYGNPNLIKDKAINASGEIIDVQYMCYTDLIEIKPGAYKVGIIGTTNDNTVTRVHGYDSNGEWIKQLDYTQLNENYGNASMIIHTENCNYIRISTRYEYAISISDYNNEKKNLFDLLFSRVYCDFETGTIAAINGSSISSAARIRTSEYIDLSTDYIIQEFDDYKFACFVYKRDKTYLGFWNGSGLEIAETPAWLDEIDVKKIRAFTQSSNPDCLIRIVIKRARSVVNPTIQDADNIFMYANTENKLYATMSVFETWAVCGASYDSGNYNDGTADYNKDHRNKSWPQILARRCGNTATNYSTGGWTAKDFVESTGPRGLTQALTDDPKELYVINFGGNDSYQFDVVPLGELTDISSHSSWQEYPATFYGYYGQIVDRLKTHAPGAVFLLTTPSSPWYTVNQLKIDNAIREIGNYYEIPVINWDDDPFIRSDIFINHMHHTHPRPVTYSGMSMAFERLFSDCVIHNIEYFNNFIPTVTS